MSDHDIRLELEEIEQRINAAIARTNVAIATTDLILQRSNLILDLLLARHRPTGMVINQIYTRDNKMGTPAGGTSIFQEVPTPAGSQFPTGTTFSWTVDDTADITLAPSPDGTQVKATCIDAPTGTSYNLTCTSSYTPPGAPTPISGTINVPIVVTPPAPTGLTINQLS